MYDFLSPETSKCIPDGWGLIQHKVQMYEQTINNVLIKTCISNDGTYQHTPSGSIYFSLIHMMIDLEDQLMHLPKWKKRFEFEFHGIETSDFITPRELYDIVVTTQVFLLYGRLEDPMREYLIKWFVERGEIPECTLDWFGHFDPESSHTTDYIEKVIIPLIKESVEQNKFDCIKQIPIPYIDYFIDHYCETHTGLIPYVIEHCQRESLEDRFKL
jgi:hypothetical protein